MKHTLSLFALILIGCMQPKQNIVINKPDFKPDDHFSTLFLSDKKNEIVKKNLLAQLKNDGFTIVKEKNKFSATKKANNPENYIDCGEIIIPIINNGNVDKIQKFAGASAYQKYQLNYKNKILSFNRTLDLTNHLTINFSEKNTNQTAIKIFTYHELDLKYYIFDEKNNLIDKKISNMMIRDHEPYQITNGGTTCHTKTTLFHDIQNIINKI